jgi:DNA-binding NtrC family response regulator
MRILQNANEMAAAVTFKPSHFRVDEPRMPERATVELRSSIPPRIGHRGKDKPLILIIDADPQVAHVTRFILNRSGFRAVSATTPEEGLHLALELRPDVIVCDATLPPIKGRTLLRILKHTHETASVPVIMMGGTEELDCQGIFTFLRKPFDTATLAGATRNALEQPPRMFD